MHIMIDLETMGTRPDAPIVAIGAVAFKPERQHKDGAMELGGIVSTFYMPIDLAKSVREGAVMDPDTVMWWLQQSDEARKEIAAGPVRYEPRDVLERLRYFMGVHAGDGIWGNGASFDNVILAETYRRLELPVPWKFYEDRCYRTIKSLYPQVEMVREGTHHNALDDARSQALHLLEIDKVMGGVL
jgi:3' exoribonuclease, RNase T-like